MKYSLRVQKMLFENIHFAFCHCWSGGSFVGTWLEIIAFFMNYLLNFYPF